MKPAVDRFDGAQVRFTDGTSSARMPSSVRPATALCSNGWQAHLVTLDEHGMPPFTGPSSSPPHPGLWFFGLDRSIYGNMHVHRHQARRLARAITRQSRVPAGSVPHRK